MDRADLVIKHVFIYNSVFQKFFLADVYVLNGKIYYIDTKQDASIACDHSIDGTGKYMVPGLVDVHMHIESSMMTPNAMARRLVECGVTTIISEPHEIANVNGMQGVKDIMDAGNDALIDIYYGIPSCVPATNPSLETTGGIMECDDMKALLDHPKVTCIGEVMNYRQVIKENDLAIGRLLDYLGKERPDYIIEGHCPALVDLDLAKFLYLGIDSDHTEHNIEELKQRFFNGMYVELQEKMMRQEVIDFIMEHDLYGHFGFVTDDVMADTLMQVGHLDAVVRKAMKLGMPFEKAIYHATYTNAVRMRLFDRTMLTPGKLADFILLDDLYEFDIFATYKKGKCVYQKGQIQEHANESHVFPDAYRHSIKVSPITKEQLRVMVQEDAKHVLVEVMEVNDGTTKTTHKQAELEVVDHEIVWENSDILLCVVMERYGKHQDLQIGYGFVSGDCIKKGAVATSFAHDHHNLLAVGSNADDLLLAINNVIDMQGGFSVVNDGQEQARLHLPVGGILSDAPANEIAHDLLQVRSAMINQGYVHYNPIMSLCTLSLLCSPALKISDKGIVDVKKGEVIPLYTVI